MKYQAIRFLKETTTIESLVGCNTLVALLRITLCLLESSADNLFKQFGPRSGLKKCQTSSESKQFDSLMVFQKTFSENINLKFKMG